MPGILQSPKETTDLFHPFVWNSTKVIIEFNFNETEQLIEG